MGKFKLNKKHSFYFLFVFLLLFSLNISSFAHYLSFPFNTCSKYFTYNGIDCTDDVDVSTSIKYLPDPYSVTTFNFPSASIYYDKYVVLENDLILYSNTDYNFSMAFCHGADNTSYTEFGLIIYYYVDGEYHSSETVFEYDIQNKVWFFIDSDYTTPDLTGDVTCHFVLSIGSYEHSTGGSMLFSLSDLEIQSISEIGGSTSGDNGSSGDDNGSTGGDNGSSGDDNGSTGGDNGSSGDDDSGSTPIYPSTDPEVKETLNQILTGTPITTPSTEKIEGTINEYDNVMSELPQVDEDELDHLMRFDFDSFTDGMDFVRTMFERTMNIFGFNSILMFALTIGLATYIIGRKVG